MAQVQSYFDPRPVTLHVQVLRDLVQLQEMRRQWMNLFEQACNPSPPLHYDWIANWLRVYGAKYVNGVDCLRIICVKRGDELVAVMPLYIRRPQRFGDAGRHLCFVSTGESQDEEICADYLDMLCLNEVRVPASELVGNVALHELEKDYDRLELSDMPNGVAMADWARRHNVEEDLQILPRGVCPLADISGGLESYLGRLSANTRQQCRRLLRAGQKHGASMDIAASPAEAEEYLQTLIDLHQKRWTADGEPGCFASERFTEFHRRLVAEWQPSGRVVLSRLRLGNEVLAIKYGFRVGRKFDFYQCGITTSECHEIKSPGILSFLLLMEHLSGQNVDLFDFLRGSSEYKARLATAARPLVQVVKVRWTWSTATGAITDLGRRGLRRLGHAAFGRLRRREATASLIE